MPQFYLYAFQANLQPFLILNYVCFRVNYDVATWGRIADTLSQDHRSINELQRATIICDVADLARTGYVSQVTVMPALMPRAEMPSAAFTFFA